MALANQTNSLLTGEAERLRASLEDAGIQVPLGHCASALKTHGNDPDRAGSWLVDTQRSSPPLPLGRTLRLPQTAGDVLVQASTGGGWSHLKLWWHASFAQLGAVPDSFSLLLEAATLERVAGNHGTAREMAARADEASEPPRSSSLPQQILGALYGTTSPAFAPCLLLSLVFATTEVLGRILTAQSLKQLCL